MSLETVHGAPSFWLRTPKVELFLTEAGGHLAPVQFRLKHRWVCPYSLAPWTPEELAADTPPILKVLRGDFFCLPFGADETAPLIHGEPANARWTLAARTARSLELTLDLTAHKGRVTKRIALNPEHRAVYQEHVIEGLRGRFNYGHHAILEWPDGEAPGWVNVSPFRYGAVKPPPFNDPAAGEYGILRPGARFDDLAAVPRLDGGLADLRRYPDRDGYEDLAMVVSQPGPLAWTAATFDGYVWLALKNPTDFPATLFWISNGGRHGAPWRGRHRRRLGLEEVCSHFSDGPKTAREDRLAAEGVATARAFSSRAPTVLRMVHCVHPVPRAFGLVTAVTPLDGEEAVRVANAAGEAVTIPVDWRYVAAAA